MLEDAVVVTPSEVPARSRAQTIALRALHGMDPDVRVVEIDLFSNGVALCQNVPRIGCLSPLSGPLWFIRLHGSIVNYRTPPGAPPQPYESLALVIRDDNRQVVIASYTDPRQG